jgi:hypothetical protein
MFNNVRYGLVVLGLLLPVISEANQCLNLKATKAPFTVCDFTFSGVPTFANLCLATFSPGTYSIKNNTPVPVKINYIRIQNNDALPAAATAIIAAPTNNCVAGTSLAAGASCNIVLNLQPLALGTFNRVLQVGVDTRQVQLSATPVTAVVNCTPAGPVPPPVPVGPHPVPFTANLAATSILAFSTVTNSGFSVVNGNLDLSPGTAVTGFPPGQVINGVQNIANATAATTLVDATTYYNSAQGLACGTNLTGQDLGTVGPLPPGVYCFNSAATLTGALVLAGSPTGAYVFQIASSLTVANNASVVLTGGVQEGNVTWAVGSSATIGTNAAFAGSIDANASISLNTGASLNGRAWALNGAVTLLDNAVNPT